jgi:hypothetical protein
MKLEIQCFTEEENVVVPEVVVPGLTTCGSSACSSTCTVGL